MKEWSPIRKLRKRSQEKGVYDKEKDSHLRNYGSRLSRRLDIDRRKNKPIRIFVDIQG